MHTTLAGRILSILLMPTALASRFAAMPPPTMVAIAVDPVSLPGTRAACGLGSSTSGWQPSRTDSGANHGRRQPNCGRHSRGWDADDPSRSAQREMVPGPGYRSRRRREGVCRRGWGLADSGSAHSRHGGDPDSRRYSQSSGGSAGDAWALRTAWEFVRRPGRGCDPARGNSRVHVRVRERGDVLLLGGHRSGNAGQIKGRLPTRNCQAR